MFMGLGFRVTPCWCLGFTVTLVLGLEFRVWGSGLDHFGV